MRTLCTALLTLGTFTVNAQGAADSSDNIAIRSLTRSIRYAKGSGDNPVVVNTEETTVYTCLKYRTDVPVVESYNDNESLDNIEISVDGKGRSSNIVKCEYFNRDGIFYSDEHICYFSLPVTKVNGLSNVTFKKTTKDPRYFTRVFFTSPFPILSMEVRVYVPDWMKVELKEFNTVPFGVKLTKSRQNNETVYIYTASNIPGIKREAYSPGITHIAPHLLVMNKAADLNGKPVRYFNNLQDQYDWYAGLVKQVQNDKDAVRPKAEELIKGATTDEEKVKRIFLWVQDNIRYIAFEDGIAGFKPEKAQEVLRKKYGDCKGMANLLTIMLQSINLDARRCWIGTKDIAYDYSTPALSVDNHMICAWMKQGKPVFLDATEKYIGYGEIAERIQGRQTLIENGEKYILTTVPVAGHSQNLSTEQRKLVIEGNHLRGHVVQVWKGESKEWLLTSLNDMKKDKQETALKEYLTDGNRNFEISNLKISNLADYNADLKVEYDLLWKNALSTFDKDSYLSLDNREALKTASIDTLKRKYALWQHFKHDIQFETELEIAGRKLTEFPAALSVRQAGYVFSASYEQRGTKLLYKSRIQINKVEIQPSEFSQWNADIRKLDAFYNQQIILNAQ